MGNRMRCRQVYTVVKVKMATLWSMESVTQDYPYHITSQHGGEASTNLPLTFVVKGLGYVLKTIIITCVVRFGLLFKYKKKTFSVNIQWYLGSRQYYKRVPLIPVEIRLVNTTLDFQYWTYLNNTDTCWGAFIVKWILFYTRVFFTLSKFQEAHS